MSTLQKKWSTIALPESSIVVAGLALTVVGLTFRDSIGLSSLLTGLGIGLTVAGSAYLAAEGPEYVRLSLAFVSLVALQLLFVGGVVRWIGGIAIGAVVLGTIYGRVST